MRVLSVATTMVGNQVMYGDEPVTGIVYRPDSEGFVSETIFVGGVSAGAEDRWEEGVVRIIGDDLPLLEPGVPLNLKGSAFTGIVYDFESSGKLSGYTGFHEGTAVGPYFSYHPNGAIASYAEIGKDTHWREGWGEKGNIRVVVRDGIYASYSEEANGLASLRLSEKVRREDLLKISLAVSRKLRLKGAGITDRLLADLSCLTDVKQLVLESTSLTSIGLNAFNACDLKLLTTRNNQFLSTDKIAEFVRQQSPCKWRNHDDH